LISNFDFTLSRIFRYIKRKKSNILNNFYFFITTRNIFCLKLILDLASILKTKSKSSKVFESIIYSGDNGVYLVKDNKHICIYPGYAFGISIFSDEIFLAISISKNSAVVSFKLKGYFIGRKISNYYQKKALYHYEKIHQIYVNKKYIFVANTGSNAITTIENTKSIFKNEVKHLYPFKDLTGFPITKDINHINSVFPLRDGILFIAHNGGNLGSLIGLIHKNKCFAFSYKNKGCHDIAPLNNGIVFSDTFGKVSNKNSNSGFYWNKKLISVPSNMVRGFHLGKKYIIIGSSVNAKREKRFDGNGSIYFIDYSNNKKFSVPSSTSQVHDIIGPNENRINSENYQNIRLIEESKDVMDILIEQFNNPIYESKINYQIELNRKIYPMETF